MTKNPRAKILIEAGLKGALGVPIVADDKVLCVLLFFMREAREENRDLVEIVSAVAAPLGSVLQQKRAEQELAEHEEHLRALLQTANDAIVCANGDGSITLWNTKAEEMFGYRAAEIQGRPVTLLMPERSRSAHEAGLWRVIRGGPTRLIGNTVELVGLKKDGSEFLIEVSLAVVKKDGDFLFTAVIRDISEHKKILESLQASERRFRALLDGVKDYAIFMLDPQGCVVTWNEGVDRITGYRAEEILGQYMSCFYSSEDIADGRPESLLRLAEVNGRAEDEGWRVRKDGSRYWADVVITALKDNDGSLRGFSKVTRDMTQRKYIEEALRESEARFRTILDNCPSMVFLKDTQGRYLYSNPEFKKITHKPSAEIVGKTDYEIFSHEQADAFCANDLKVLEAGVPLQFEEVAVHEDGPHTSVVSKFPLFDAQKKLYALCGIVMDITDRKRTEQALSQAREELETRVQERTAELVQFNRALQAEIADRGRIQQQADARAKQQAAVSQIGQLALSGADLSPVMEEACALVARALNVEFCKVLELLPDGQALRLRAGVGWKEGSVGHATVGSGFSSQAGYTLLSRAPVIVEDLQSETRFRGPPLLHEHGVKSGMSVIIRGKDRPFGVLGAHTTKQRTFSGDDVHFLEAVANVLSNAIERKNAEEEIRRGANWLEHLIEATQDAVVSIDRQARIVLFNAGAERIFGYSRVEIQGQKVNVLMAEPYAVEHDSYIERYEETGEARAIGRIRTVEARRKNGQIFPIELSITKVASVESEEVQYAAFIRDISEVRRGQAWLQRLIETTQDAVLSIDRQGRVVLFNPAAERIFGYTRNEIVGQKVNLLMAEPYASEHDGYIKRYEGTGEAHAIGRIRTVTAMRKNGELFPIELSVTEIELDQDVHYAAFIRDISEKAKLEEQLMERERLATIGATSAKIGHELANPLNGMSLTIQLLEQRLNQQPDGQVTVTVKRLKDEISRLNQLAAQFLTISRREKYGLKPTELADLIDDVIKVQEPHFAKRRIQAENFVPADLPLITVDRDKIKQALLNLLKNAAEAMPHGGKITIEACTTDEGILVDISDTGTGIPLGVDVFEPFVTTKKEGTGIGLFIVRQIVTAHGGKISYHSCPGEGTTFRIELPRK
jgi:PAS domain S-box-containing protein